MPAYSDDDIYSAMTRASAGGASTNNVVDTLLNSGVSADQLIGTYQTHRPDMFAQGADFAGAAATGNFTGQRWDAMGDMSDYVRGRAASLSGGGTGGTTGGTGTGGGSGSSAPSFNLSAAQGPATWDVTPNQTVASQLETILRSDSPLMQLARTRAQQRMAANGTQNSAMAASAGEAAMIDAAMPIATADAGTFGRAAEVNTGSTNAFTRDANAFGRDQTMANFNLSANDWAAGRAADRASTAADQNLRRELELQSARNRADSGSQEATLQRGYIQSINTARSDYAQRLAEISSSTTMDSGLKAETLRNLQTTYNTLIGNYSRMLGWDASSWLIAADAAPEPTLAPTPAPVATTVENV